MLPKCYQIVTDYFTASFVMIGGRVQKTAPIIKYMSHWNLHTIKDYCKKKGWRLIEIY